MNQIEMQEAAERFTVVEEEYQRASYLQAAATKAFQDAVEARIKAKKNLMALVDNATQDRIFFVQGQQCLYVNWANGIKLIKPEPIPEGNVATPSATSTEVWSL